MSEFSDELLCVFSGQLQERDGTTVIEVPEQELSLGAVSLGETYRIAIVSSPKNATQPAGGTGADGVEKRPAPPVSEGECREVEIVDMGDQGDGIARVERGFVIIVPGTDVGENPTIEITDVRPNVAFGSVTDDHTTPQSPD